MTSSCPGMSRPVCGGGWKANHRRPVDGRGHVVSAACFFERTRILRRRGSVYEEAIEPTGKSCSRLASAKYVCKQVPFCRRRQELSFERHHEVASLTPEDQVRFLDLAEDEGLTKQELRERIKHRDNPPAARGLRLAGGCPP